MSALFEQVKQCVADVTVQRVDRVVAAADGDVSTADAANDVYDSLKARSYASGPGVPRDWAVPASVPLPTAWDNPNHWMFNFPEPY